MTYVVLIKKKKWTFEKSKMFIDWKNIQIVLLESKLCISNKKREMQVIFFFCISTEQKLLLSNENVNIGALGEYVMLTY